MTTFWIAEKVTYFTFEFIFTTIQFIFNTIYKFYFIF